MASPKKKSEAAETAPGSTLKTKISIRSQSGLHARPAALFVQIANRFKCDIRVRKGRREVDGKSIMGILTLAAERGSTIEVTAKGPDAENALQILGQVLARAELPAVVNVVKHR